MQRHVADRLKQYLRLVRLPNVFTAPSNVLAGYFAAVPITDANGVHLGMLMISSGFLYVAGIVLNDYFDIDIDRRERPSRPLPSGRITKRNALALAIIALVIANTLTLTIAIASLAVSITLTGLILAYNYRLKHSISGSFAMAGARFTNVLLGASTLLLFAIPGTSSAIVLTAATSLFLYTLAIMVLSRKEVGNQRPNSTISLTLVGAVVAFLIPFGLLTGLQWTFLVNLSAFAMLTGFTFKKYLLTGSPSVQNAIRNMVISIIVLDSVFVSGTAGFTYGLATLLLLVPSAVLARKLYVT